MVTSLLPLLSNLTAAPLDELLSPEYDADNNRKIIDLKSLFDTGGVLHIAIDSLSDHQTAQKLVQLLVADAAVSPVRATTAKGITAHRSRTCEGGLCFR